MRTHIGGSKNKQTSTPRHGPSRTFGNQSTIQLYFFLSWILAPHDRVPKSWVSSNFCGHLHTLGAKRPSLEGADFMLMLRPAHDPMFSSLLYDDKSYIVCGI